MLDFYVQKGLHNNILIQEKSFNSKNSYCINKENNYLLSQYANTKGRYRNPVRNLETCNNNFKNLKAHSKVWDNNWKPF